MRRSVLCVVALALAHVQPVASQQAGPVLTAEYRNDCRLAAQMLETGHPQPHRAWSLGIISGCGAEGPATLASVWRSITAGEEIGPLVRSSLRLRDARLYRQLRETAVDRSRPGAVRAAAMLVLARYTNSGNAIWLSDLVPPDTVTRIRLVPSSGIGLNQVEGASPLREPIAAPVLALLDEIASARGTEEKAVWYAAAVLAKRLRSDIANGAAH
ncbi:MAG TPA: hypothetical protein VF665_02930 [Longimicrobium sp.]|jgi:hypothetical protein|uniref:hypothetical protein n=1 Tax=Longimicrobium sp. TaxID=2029185 RepID=UPI002EDB2C49